MRKKFQLIISLSILLIMLAGSLTFILISRTWMNQRLTKQVILDNEVIGKEILDLIASRITVPDDSLAISTLQGLCDEVMLPYDGFICVMTTSGDLVAAPGLAGKGPMPMGIRSFTSLDGTDISSESDLGSEENLGGILIHMEGQMTDIVASLPIGSGDLRLNVHQSTGSVFRQTRAFLKGLVLISALLSLLVTLMGYLLTERIVRGYESQIEVQNRIIALKNKDLTDSIKYAGFLQNAYLPDQEALERLFPTSFILHRPRDLVSGDFFYAEEIGATRYFAVIDCTGHGVPGSLLSMIAFGLLEEALHLKKLEGPASVLNYLCRRFPETLTREGDWRNTDGMDIGIASFTEGEGHFRFAGANHPMLLARDGEITKYKGVRHSIGMLTENSEDCFQEHVVEIREGDMLYLFTDGYIDQFGGPNDKKFLMSRFRELLLKTAGHAPSKQKELLEQALDQWQGDAPQVDDITVLGLQITSNFV